MPIDAASKTAPLATALSAAVEGEVRFDPGSRALYANDSSNYRHLPTGVVIPRTLDDLRRAVAVCRAHGAPIVSRGAGTGLAGQSINVAVVIDGSKYLRRIQAIDREKRLARVEPGVVCDQLRDAASEHGLTFGPDPATHRYCTLGGMIGNDSCGVHSVFAGKTSDNVRRLQVLTYDGCEMSVGETGEAELRSYCSERGRRGEIYRALVALVDRWAGEIRAHMPRIPRKISGYNLDQLLPENGFNVARALVGSEGTLVTVLEAELQLIASPRHRRLLVLGYPDIYSAADHVIEVLSHRPIGLEAIDDVLVAHLRRKNLGADGIDLLPEGNGWLLVELAGDDAEEAYARAEGLRSRLAKLRDAPSARICTASEEEKIWYLRESALGATAFVPGERPSWEGWEDAAVPPEELGSYLREFRALLSRFDYQGALYGHFGDGCVHTRINFELDQPEGVRRFRQFLEAASDLVVRYGGSFSGEHGDGQARSELLPKLFGPELMEAFRTFKTIWDPEGKMNPGRIVDPVPMVRDLQQRIDARLQPISTHLRFADEGGFTRATGRCVGVGKCRQLSGGVMCPSYRATLEEKHSTRGRARLLHGMLIGDAVRGGFRDPAVKEALDLCLECKGCKGECPVRVDVASYKAEFLSHYYQRRLRPRAAYSMGQIAFWARLASLAPRLANSAAAAPLIGSLIKLLAGIAPDRELPRFAPFTFRHWLASRPKRTREGRAVLLWPDTFTNYFHPEIGIAAVEVLEALGFTVNIPRRVLCCGRPLYSYGFLSRARSRLMSILRLLSPQISRGMPIVFLEPSCASVFKDELLGFFPDDPAARALAERSVLFSELVLDAIGRETLAPIGGSVLVHRHCHHSVLGSRADVALLERIGVEVETLDAGCCGMAGAFGFEAAHAGLSRAIGELALLPRVRALPPEIEIVADGFSCHEQIRQECAKQALHVAQLARRAIGDELEGPPRRDTLDGT